MIQLLTEREIEFLTKLKGLIIEFNAEIYCLNTKNIQITIDAHLDQDWKNPIGCSNCLDEFDIDSLLKKTQLHTKQIIERNNAPESSKN